VFGKDLGTGWKKKKALEKGEKGFLFVQKTGRQAAGRRVKVNR